MKLLIILTVTLGTLVTGLDSVSFEISRVAGVVEMVSLGTAFALVMLLLWTVCLLT